MKIIASILLWLLLASASFAQNGNQFPTHTAGQTVVGVVSMCLDSGNRAVPTNQSGNCPGGGGSSGAVFGPTSVGAAAANPPVLVGGTVDGTATGLVSILKVLNGTAFINCANCSGSGISVAYAGSIGAVGTPGGFKDGSGNFQPLLGDVTNGQWVNIKAAANLTVVQPTGTNLHVVCDSGCSGGGGGGTSSNFGAAFPTAGTAAGMSQGGNMVAFTGTSGNLNVAFSNTTIAVTNTGTFAVQAAQNGTWNVTNISGTISLPTGASTSALQTTGNTSLSSIDGKTPALGQALAAASSPVVLTAAQITTLTPPAAITNFALETGGNLATVNTNLGAPGATACTTDTASCSLNQLLQRNNQRLTTINTTLGTPFQAGGSIGNTSFGISGTLPAFAATPTFNLGTLNGAATAANQTSVIGTINAGTAAANSIAVGGVFNSTPLTLTNTQQSSLQVDANGFLKVNVVVGGGGTGGTASTFGAAFPTLGTPVGFTQGGNFVAATGTSGNLNVQCANCSGSGASAVDEATFTAGTSVLAPGGGFFQTTATSNPLTTGQQGMVQMTAQRAFFTNLRNASGTEIGTAATPLQVSLANTGSNATAVLVTGTGGTFPVSQATAASLNATVVGTGTFAVQAAQSGTWNVTNISGTISLPTGAATSANQPTNAAQGSTTSGQTGNLHLGAVTTAAPTYTTAQSSPLSLTTAGALRIDGSGVTQPVSGTVAFSNSTIAVTQATASSLNATVVGTGTFAVQAAQSGTWNVTNISGTVSLPTGASTSALQPTNAAQGSTTSGQTGNLHLGAVTTAAPTYTTAQSSPLSLTTSGGLRVDGSGTTQPVSGTVAFSNTTIAVTNAGTFAVQATLQASATTAIGKVDPNTIGTWGIQASTQNSATPTNGGLVLAQFNTTPTTITSGNVSPLQMDNSGNLLVNIKAGASSGAVAQGSTTSGQTGGLTQAAVTTSAPTYTTATTNPLSMDTSGNLRINCITGCGGTGSISNATSGVATSSTNTGTVAYNYGFNGTTWDQLQVDASKFLKVNISAGTAAMTQAAGSVVSGAYLSGAFASGSMVDVTNLSAPITPATATATKSALLGMQFNSTQATFTNGQQGSVQGSSRGALFVATGADTFNVTVNAALPAGTNLVGKVGIDQTTPGTTNGTQDASTGTTGSAVPSKGAYIAANGSGNLTGEIVCDNSTVYDASTSGPTQLVALSSGKTIYVCGYAITVGGTATNVNLSYGTGTACATGTTKLTPAYQIIANGGIVDHASNHWGGMKSAASNALCINSSAANAVQATIYWTQF